MGREEIRFKSFSERIASISVDVIHRVDRSRQYGAAEPTGTHFSEALEKWLELNCTQEFTELANILGPDVHTLPQLLHAKQAIFKLLQLQLSRKDSTSLEAILELVVALARDLQDEFYPQFADFFKVITMTHLRQRDADTIEKVFTALAYLFKFQWRLMVNDIKAVFALYVPLLSEEHKDHVKAFAAESFAFLLRKVPDKAGLLDLMFAHADRDSDVARGLGVLFFEMLKGVKTRVHSCSEQVFPLIIQRLTHRSTGDATETRLQIVRTMLELLCNHLAPEHSGFIWDTLKERFHSTVDLTPSHFAALCQCYEEVITFGDGKLVSLRPDEICLTFAEAFTFCPEEAVVHLLDAVGLVMKVCERRGATEASIRAILDSFRESKQAAEEDCLIEFLDKLSKLQCFHKDVIPAFWTYCEKQEPRMALRLLSKLESLAGSTIHCAPDLLHWRPIAYLQDIEQTVLANYLFTCLSLTDSKAKSVEHLECFWASCCLVRHLQALWGVTEIVKQLQVSLVNLLAQKNFDLLHLACIQESVRSLVALKAKVEPTIILPLLQKHKVPFVLRTMDLALYSNTGAHKTDLHTDLFNELWWLLASPYAIVRFLSLRILSHFEPADKYVPKGKFAVCRHMLALEGVAVTLHEFKNRINMIDKLKFDTVLKNSLDTKYCRCALAFLCGQLYINFSQLWGSVKEIIGTYSDYEGFWHVIDRQLEETSMAIRGAQGDTSLLIPNETANSALLELLSVTEMYERVDHDLHRVFLWNIIEKVKDSAIISNIPYEHFMSLYEIDFRPRSEFIASENVLQNSKSEDDECAMDVSEDQDPIESKQSAETNTIIIEDDVNDDGSDQNVDNILPEDSASMTDGVTRERSLTAHQKYGVKVKGGKAIAPGRNPIAGLKAALAAMAQSNLGHMEAAKREQLEERFRDLLMFPEAAMQKLALDSLLACGVSVLHGYREEFLKLLDDKQWRNALNECFLARDNLGCEDAGKAVSCQPLPQYQGEMEKSYKSVCVMTETQRKQVLPYAMRLLFGRMLTKKTGHNSKSRVVSKHSSVLRFLASSRESDLIYFIELILLPLRRYNLCTETATDISTQQLLSTVTFDPEHAMPLRRIRQVLSNIRHVLNHMAGILPSCLPLLLRSVILVLRYSNLVTKRALEINRFYAHSIKRVRMLCVDLIHQFFSTLDRFAMPLEDVHHFFEQYMWPQLSELIRRPTDEAARVFRLVLCFASKEHLQFLLGLRSREDPTRTILTDLMTVLSTDSVHQGVVNSIRNAIKMLLSDVEADANAARIVYSFDDIDLHCNTEPALGFRLVMPFTYVILSRPLKLMKEQRRPMDPVDRFILFKLSKYNTDQTLASNMLSLIVPTVCRRTRKDNDNTSEHETLCIIKNLVVMADSVEDVFLPLSRMWAAVRERQSRNVLLDTFQVLSTKMSAINSEVCDILGKVNSWDARLAEEPNYLLRIKGFRELVALIEAMKVPQVNTTLPLLHNCIYASLSSSDLSLRDAGTHALTKIITFCNDVLSEGQEQFFKTCVEQEIYAALKRGFRSTEETTRHESVKILTHILSTCGERKAFQELRSFQDTEKEKDFFECIAHIQMHRRARALNRLSSTLAKRHVSPRSITDVFLPLTESFLLKEQYAKQGITESAIQALGALARKLPWRSYARLVDKYITLLTNKELCSIRANQKCVVKIVVTLLDAFHFDLSQLVSVFEETTTTTTGGLLSLEERLALPTPDVPLSLDAEMDFDEEQPDAGIGAEGDKGVSSRLDGDEVDDSQLPPDGSVTVVDIKMAKNILQTLKDMLLTRLQSAISRKSYYSADEDDDNEENDVLRVPIAVAMVKLLSLLPSKTFLHRNLPSVLLKVVVFLKSRLLPVREAARSALVKIITILGPCYLKYVIREMRSLLSRGFQLHVLSFTTHAVLSAVQSQMQTGDLDECVDDILEICLEEQFGEVAAEKDVAAITAKTDEAKRVKSLDMFRIVAAVVSDDQLSTLLKAVEEKLLAGNNAKTVSKCERILDELTAGLETNKGLSKTAIYVFCYKLLDENVPRLLVADPILAKEIEEEHGKQSYPRASVAAYDPNHEKCLSSERSDVFLVPKAPVRGIAGALVSVKANVHVLVGAALKLLRDILRKNRGQELAKSLEMLDPFVAPLSRLQRCSYVKVTTLTMVVLQQLLHYPLPSFKAHLQTIINTTMSIIHKYLGTTQKSGLNYDMLIAAFKTIRCILNEVKDVDLSEEQYKLLLMYVETDVCDVERQGVAFSLLAAIIDRGVNLPELHTLMKKVAEMSIQEQMTAMRNQARQVYQKYLFDYPIGPKLREKCVAFYLGQLEYAIEEGRQSAAEMVYQIIKLYPENLLAKSALIFFVPLSASLVNDASTTLRKMCYGCLKALLEKLNDNTRTSLYVLARKWLQDSSKVQKQYLGAQVIGCFAEVEKDKFASRVDDLMGFLIELIQRKSEDVDQQEKAEPEAEERQQDRLIYLVLNTCVKILSHVRLFESESATHRALCSSLMSSCQAYLLYPHSWVRVAVAQLFGLLFVRYEPRGLAEKILLLEPPVAEEPTHSDWLLCGGRSLIDSLAVAFLEQFQSRQVPEELLEQLVKNLLFIGKVLIYLECGDQKKPSATTCNGSGLVDESGLDIEDEQLQAEPEEDECDRTGAEAKHRTLGWFIFKIERELRLLGGNRREPNFEKRICLYKLLAALSLECPREVLQRYSRNFLRPLVRDLESSVEHKEQGFSQLVKEVSHVIRRGMGFDQYQEGYAHQLTELARLKARRRQSRAVERMLDPQQNLERKERRKKLDKANRKRNLDTARGKIPTKKSRAEGDEVVRVNREADNM